MQFKFILNNKILNNSYLIFFIFESPSDFVKCNLLYNFYINQLNKMKRSFKVFAISFFIPILLFAQNITHGPIIGGLTYNSFRIYTRTNTPTTIEIQLSTAQTFSTYTSEYLTTSITKDNSGIQTIKNLQANTKYFYRLKINKVQQGDIGSFTTFPKDGQKGNYTLLFGSCTDDTSSDAVFIEMQQLLRSHYKY